MRLSAPFSKLYNALHTKFIAFFETNKYIHTHNTRAIIQAVTEQNLETCYFKILPRADSSIRSSLGKGDKFHPLIKTSRNPQKKLRTHTRVPIPPFPRRNVNHVKNRRKFKGGKEVCFHEIREHSGANPRGKWEPSARTQNKSADEWKRRARRVRDKRNEHEARWKKWKRAKRVFWRWITR